MEQEELWKDVVGYEEYFRVSNLGRIFGKRSSKILKGSVNSGGYLSINTRFGNRSGPTGHFLIHRAVVEAFLDAPSEELLKLKSTTFYAIVPVNHKDGDKLNNCSTNLEWCTYKENSKHAVDLGLHGSINKTGLDSKNFSLTKEQVEFIVKNYISHDRQFGARALARKLGVGRGPIDLAVELYINKKIEIG